MLDVPTPVGPVPRDPNDPDLWDWEVEDERPAAGRHPARVVAAIAILALVLLLIVTHV